MSKDITKAVPLLQEFWPVLQRWFAARYTNYSLTLTSIDRPPVEQLRLFCQGRLPENKGEIVTYRDGFNVRSTHNALPLSKAFDVGILRGIEFDWTDATALLLQPALHDTGYAGKIIWGGVWPKPDSYHFEVSI